MQRSRKPKTPRIRKQPHVHKYERMQFTYSHKTWACRQPDCMHYIPGYLAHTAEGRYSLCWDCEKQFRLDEEAMKEDRPRCADCRNAALPVVPVRETPIVVENIEEAIKQAGLENLFRRK